MWDEWPLRLMIAAYVAFLLVLLVITIALTLTRTRSGRGRCVSADHSGVSIEPQVDDRAGGGQ